MKKNICLVVSVLLCVYLVKYVSTFFFLDKSDNYHYEKYLAISLDNVRVSEFPAKGDYKVDVKCNNADGKWLYDEWKLAIDNIHGDITCDVDFSTIKKEYFNDYLEGLINTEQGNGMFASEEIVTYGDYSSASIISQSDYKNVSTFIGSSNLSNSGTNTSNLFSFSNGVWSSNTSNMVNGKNYIMKFYLSEGYYQVCYTVSSTGNDYNFVDVNTLNSVWATAGSSDVCKNLGYIKDTDYIRAVHQTKSSTITSFSFYIKKGKQNTLNTGNRYQGLNPNNYVWFNNEYWRIIGLFGENIHGQLNKKLVKIIRDESIGFLQTENNSANTWAETGLKEILNTAYYNSQDGTSNSKCLGMYGFPQICNFTTIGIKNSYKNMIVNAKWHLGKISKSHSFSASDLFSDEMSDTNMGEFYVGLMYASDFAYSMLPSDCARSTTDISFSCRGLSWLFSSGDEWTCTYPWYLSKDGEVSWQGSQYAYNVRPALFLDASVYKIDGDGSLENPYIIGM